MPSPGPAAPQWIRNHHAKDNIFKGSDHRTEHCAARILEIDPYNEEACRALMEVNIQRGDYNTATAHYQRLKKKLAGAGHRPRGRDGAPGGGPVRHGEGQAPPRAGVRPAGLDL